MLALPLVAHLLADAGLVDELPLLPLASLHRPTPIEVENGEEAPQLRGCSTRPLPPLTERLPFGPGELLSYDITYLGVRMGKVNLRVGERALMDAVPTYPLHAQAKTDGFLTVLGSFDARMVSFFDPSALLPVRMVSRTVARQPFSDKQTISREDGAFAPAVVTVDGPRGGEVNARLRRQAPDAPHVDRTARLKTGADVVDALSVIYYVRSRELVEGSAFCFELYHRRRLWRVEGKVGGIEIVRPPAGARRGQRLDAELKAPGKTPPRPVTVWITDDADRVPLLVRTPDGLGQIEVRLLAHQRGRRLVER